MSGLDLFHPRRSTRSLPYWDGVAEHRLMYQRCERCDHRWHIPTDACPICGGSASWRESSGAGTVYSFTAVHRPPLRELRSDSPYIVGLVDLTEGPRVMAWLVEAPEPAWRIGVDVEAVFLPGPAGIELPMFRPAVCP